MRFSILALALVLVACPKAERLEPPVSECTHTSDCTSVQICSAGGRCVPQCAADRDCGSGQTCTASACVFPSGHCGRDADCLQGQVCGANGTCGRTCASSGACGAGFVCLGNVCLAQQPECAKDVDCGSGRVCTSGFTCAQSCTAAAQCATAQTCSAGICVPAPPQCATSADCTSPQVCRQARCVAQCAADQDCGAGQRCQSGTCQQLPAQCVRNSDCPINKACVAGSCADACLVSKDCPAGNICNLGLCVLPAPQCAAATDCASGQACSPAGQCVAACTTTSNCASGLSCWNGACLATGLDTATIGGSATYSGQSNSAGIAVKLTGAGLAQATTDATGAYKFAGLPPGIYTVTVTAAFSAEGTFSFQVSARAGVTTTAPAVTFTPRGEVRGKVILAGQSSALNVNVFVAGSSRGASTDSSGNYDIPGVPTGPQQVVASYPGYNAASATVTVVIGMVTQVPDLTLQPQVAVNNAVFAFASTPPLSVVLGRSYVYTAVAGGGGVTGVTYSMAAGPPGMTIDAPSGAVSFTPTVLGSVTVAIAAKGGGAIIYQVFNLVVVPQTQLVVPTPGIVRDGDTAGSVSWVAQQQALHRFSPQRTSFDAVTPQRVAATTSVALSNGAKINGYSTPGGPVSDLRAAVGKVSATWTGGTIATTAGSVSFGNSYLVASKPTVDTMGTVASLAVQGLDTAISMKYSSGTAQSITANKIVPTSVESNDSGIPTSLTATVLTDTAEQWSAADGATNKKITDANFTQCYSVTVSKTNHTLTATLTTGQPDLTTVFGGGHRYFLMDYCGNYGSLAFTVKQPAKDFTGLAGRYFDVYLNGARYSNYVIAPAPANGSFTFTALFRDYSLLRDLPSLGFILIVEAGGWHLCTLTDSTPPGFPTASGGLTGQSVGAPFDPTTYVIDSNTATTIVFRVGSGTDINKVLTRLPYLVIGAQGVPATVKLTKGGLPASAKYLLNDSTGVTYPVITFDPAIPNTVTVGIQPKDLGSSWANALVVPVAAVNNSATFVMTNAVNLLSSGALVGRSFFIRSGGSASVMGTISANGTGAVTFASFDCDGCTGRVQSTQNLVIPGATWAAALNGQLRIQVTVQGTPWSPDTLVGRAMLPETNLGVQATVLSNLASSAIVQVGGDFGAVDAFTSLSTTQHVYIAEQSPSLGLTIPVTVTDGTNQNWGTNNAYVGMQFIDSYGRVLGPVSAHTNNTATVAAPLYYLDRLVAGEPFAFGLPYGTTQCSSGQINATIKLASIPGMTTVLVPGAYDTFRGGLYISFPVLSNDASGALVPVCGYNFRSLVSLLGSTAWFTTGGSTQVTIDSGVSYATDQFKGFQIRPLSGDPYFYETLVGNVGTSLTFNTTGYVLNDLNIFAKGTSFYLSDANGFMNLTITTTPGLTAGALAGRFVHALPTNYYVSDKPLAVVTNDAISLTAKVNVQEFKDFVAGKYTTLQLSSGTVLTLGDSSATFPANSLLGQVAQFFFNNYLVVSNTATSLVLTTSDTTYAGYLPAAGASYVIPAALLGATRVRAQSDGTAWVGMGGAQAAIAKVGASGLTTLFTPLGTGKQIQVTPRPALVGTYSSITGSPPFYKITDATASFGALAGAAVSVRDNSGWNTYVVVKNDSTSLTIFTGNSLLFPGSLKAYLIDTMRLDVTNGVSLAAHAYAGAQLWLQGVTYLVRDNDSSGPGTTSSLLLYQAGSPSSAPAALADTGGAPAWLLTGLRGRRVNGIALNGSGFVAATDDGLALFDGTTTWSRVGVRESSGPVPLATGTVDDFTAYSVTCTLCNFPTGSSSLAGAQLLLSDGPHYIQGNSAHVLNLGSSLTQERAPLFGDAFVVLDGKGLSGEANDVAVDGTTTWVPFANGLLKNVGSAWSQLNASSTESAPGKGDGLPADTLTSAAVHTAGELWVASRNSGVARLSGTTWQQFTAAGTESAPGKGDGLPGNAIGRFSFDGTKTWFAGWGAASFDGTTWTAVPYSLVGSVNVVVIPSSGVDWFGTYNGLFRIAP